MHVDCFSGLIQLACLLPQKEDNLRNRTTKVLLSILHFLRDFLISPLLVLLKTMLLLLLLIYIMILQILLAVSEHFGDTYLTHIILPVFLVAVGDDADLTFFPPNIHLRIKGIGFLEFC